MAPLRLSSQLYAYVSALRPCRPCLEHAKNCSLVSWSGPACPPVSPARAPAAACCPLCLLCLWPPWPRPSFRLGLLGLSPRPPALSSSPSSFLAPPFPVLPLLCLPFLSSFSSLPFRCPSVRGWPLVGGSVSSCAFGLVSGSSVRLLLLCCAWAVGGLLSVCCLLPRCRKLVSSTSLSIEACTSSISERLG